MLDIDFLEELNTVDDLFVKCRVRMVSTHSGAVVEEDGLVDIITGGIYITSGILTGRRVNEVGEENLRKIRTIDFAVGDTLTLDFTVTFS